MEFDDDGMILDEEPSCSQMRSGSEMFKMEEGSEPIDVGSCFHVAELRVFAYQERQNI